MFKLRPTHAVARVECRFAEAIYCTLLTETGHELQHREVDILLLTRLYLQ
jgi:hypothetical protein